MSQSSKCDASCRVLFFFVAARSHGGCLFQSSCSESFVINSYLEKLIMHQLSSLHAFLSFTFFSGGFFYVFSNMQISLYTDNKLI